MQSLDMPVGACCYPPRNLDLHRSTWLRIKLQQSGRRCDLDNSCSAVGIGYRPHSGLPPPYIMHRCVGMGAQTVELQRLTDGRLGLEQGLEFCCKGRTLPSSPSKKFIKFRLVRIFRECSALRGSALP